MQEIAHLLHEQAFDPVRLQRSVSGSIVDSRRLGTLSDGVCDLLESRSLHELEILVPGSARVDLSVFSLASGGVEELIDETGRRRNAADHERGLAHALECSGECLHMRDFASHEEL